MSSEHTFIISTKSLNTYRVIMNFNVPSLPDKYIFSHQMGVVNIIENGVIVQTFNLENEFPTSQLTLEYKTYNNIVLVEYYCDRVEVKDQVSVTMRISVTPPSGNYTLTKDNTSHRFDYYYQP